MASRSSSPRPNSADCPSWRVHPAPPGRCSPSVRGEIDESCSALTSAFSKGPRQLSSTATPERYGPTADPSGRYLRQRRRPTRPETARHHPRPTVRSLSHRGRQRPVRHPRRSIKLGRRPSHTGVRGTARRRGPRRIDGCLVGDYLHGTAALGASSRAEVTSMSFSSLGSLSMVSSPKGGLGSAGDDLVADGCVERERSVEISHTKPKCNVLIDSPSRVGVLEGPPRGAADTRGCKWPRSESRSATCVTTARRSSSRLLRATASANHMAIRGVRCCAFLVAGVRAYRPARRGSGPPPGGCRRDRARRRRSHARRRRMG